MDIFPIVEEDFITRQSRNIILNWIKQNENLFDRHKSSIEYWNGKCICYNEEYIPHDIKYILKEICLGMRRYIEINIPYVRYLYVEHPQIVIWREGDEMTPHADNIEQDNITPNKSPWRSFGSVLYLNSDFEGGKIYYPNLGIEVSPRPGMVVLHPADIKYTHGVSKITQGKRYTVSTFFTYDEDRAGFIYD
jgi:hypothetical protein